MIRLARHIEILLLGNECVIVPDFGGFVAHRVNAAYDNSDELFLPPMRVLGFNPQLKINDSLLAQSYVEAYDLSYPDAVSTVADEVAEMRHMLADYGKYELNGLGVLYYDKDGKLNFDPFEGGLLTPEFYALASFDMPVLHEDRDLSAESPDYAEGISPNHAKIVYIGGEKGQKTLNISLRAVRNLSVAAVILAAVFIIAFPIVTGRQGLVPGNVESGFYEMFNPAHEATADNNTVTMKAVRQHPQASSRKPVAKIAETAPKPHSATVADYADKPWSIVVCTHVGRKSAEQLAEKLRSAGYDDIFVDANGAVKVLYGHYETIDEAHKRLNELVGNDYFKDAWLLKVKK